MSSVTEGATTLERRGLRLVQPGGNELLLFTLAASEILQIAEISRIGRSDQGQLIGYQRPEVRQHIANIRDYLDGDDIVFPNPIILALSADAVTFRGSRGPKTSDGYATAGTIEIDLRAGKKPGWIVDGQQRALAMEGIQRRDLPVPVTAFVTDNIELQREQFIRVNSTKPLPRGLVTELLPAVSVPISPKMAARKLPSALCDQLHRHEDSPFRGLIKRPSATPAEKSSAVVADTSIVKMLEESLKSSSGCLFPYRNLATGEADLEGIWAVLTLYWTAVRETFPEAWGKTPQRSRLMHGAGIRSMGRLMDKVMATLNPHADGALSQVRAELALVAPICRWTSGTWEGLDMGWNQIQNVPRDVSALSNLLIRHYVSTRMAA